MQDSDIKKLLLVTANSYASIAKTLKEVARTLPGEVDISSVQVKVEDQEIKQEDSTKKAKKPTQHWFDTWENKRDLERFEKTLLEHGPKVEPLMKEFQGDPTKNKDKICKLLNVYCQAIGIPSPCPPGDKKRKKPSEQTEEKPEEKQVEQKSKKKKSSSNIFQKKKGGDTESFSVDTGADDPIVFRKSQTYDE